LFVKKLRIPKKRVETIKKIKNKIENNGCVKIEIDDDITITGESLNVFNTVNVITAIGRGFSPSDAFKLFEDDNTLYILPISKNKNTLNRIRARIIGTRGKVKTKIEQLTNTKISVFGKTVSIIGSGCELETARVAIEKIIEGKSHPTVFKFLENSVREM